MDSIVEHLDVPATVRELAGAPAIPGSEGRSLSGFFQGEDPPSRAVSVSENWGFASFETDRYKLVVDEDGRQACQLFDLHADPDEDDNRLADSEYRGVVEELMGTHVRPFLATPPVRPHKSPFFLAL